MAADEALLCDAGRTGHAYLRLYRWNPPCLSFGAHEPALRRYDPAAIRTRRLDVVRRPTGGRAVWHEHELTYAVALPTVGLGDVTTSCHAIHHRVAAALRALGARVELAPRPGGPARPGDGPCFAAAAAGELHVEALKLVGSAQLRRGGALLQHGSVLLDGSQATVDAVASPPAAATRHTTLRRALGRPSSFAEVAAALLHTWCTPGERLVEVALESAPTFHPTDFSDPAWTWRR
jgi:lipoate-protein ligase A